LANIFVHRTVHFLTYTHCFTVVFPLIEASYTLTYLRLSEGT